MLDDLAYDDSEEPTIGLVPPGVSWDEVRDHIKIVHGPLLVGPAASGQYAGAYWASTGWWWPTILDPTRRRRCASSGTSCTSGARSRRSRPATTRRRGQESRRQVR